MAAASTAVTVTAEAAVAAVAEQPPAVAAGPATDTAGSPVAEQPRVPAGPACSAADSPGAADSAAAV
ncbi:Uncharacterised protein [Mycobacterium tuberculosis]|nr:Uncharacterised protein [Mycobacterium tuberculosis]CFG70444.1 Uncharacterised protein [Mycobacterium tuberculosis]CKR24878.1 Uncharacterised protein [Mycobacterium tuberculosis]CMN92070.1 Uncharacterised protein [Mycobacterium tuberculosis]CMO85430.1 Uncharacterised protein [Mycobacterium tuberculosis]